MMISFFRRLFPGFFAIRQPLVVRAERQIQPPHVRYLKGRR